MALIDNFKEVRQFSLQMVRPLHTEDFVPQAAFFASPPKWNLAHTSWFFEEVILKKFKKDYKPFHPQYGFLFNSYYNSLGQRVMRQDRGSLSRPTVKEVLNYRNYIDEQMLELLALKNENKNLADLVMLGLNHEQQHQELFFTDLKYNFETSKHPQLIGWFNKTFIKEGIIDIKYNKILRDAYKNRISSDYDAFVEFTKGDKLVICNGNYKMKHSLTRLMTAMNSPDDVNREEAYNEFIYKNVFYFYCLFHYTGMCSGTNRQCWYLSS